MHQVNHLVTTPTEVTELLHFKEWQTSVSLPYKRWSESQYDHMVNVCIKFSRDFIEEMYKLCKIFELY